MLSIDKLLQNRLQAFADTNSLLISWPNVAFVPPSAASWLQVDMLPAEPQLIDLQGKGVVYSGDMQVLVWSAVGTGSQANSAIVDALREHFKVNTRLDNGAGVVVFVDSPPIVYNAQDGATGFAVPVSIPYRSLTVELP